MNNAAKAAARAAQAKRLKKARKKEAPMTVRKIKNGKRIKP